MKIKVAVLFGGKSVEHEISIISALQAIKNFDIEKYEIVPIYISKENKWYTGESLLNIENYRDLNNIKKISKEVYMKLDYDNSNIYDSKNNKVVDKIDVAFPVLHGGSGEDGKLAGFFEMINIPYASSNTYAAAICMDKEITKKILLASYIKQIMYTSFYYKDFIKDEESILREVEEIGYPVILKPATLGSSVGIYKAKNEEEFLDLIFETAKYTNKIIVEKCVENLREVNISVIGDYEEQVVSAIEEPCTADEILTYNDKYKGSSSEGTMESLSRKIPANITDEMKEEVISTAKDAFKAIGCSGVVRIDFIIDSENVYINEINTIPGSLSFYLWKYKNVSYKEEIDMLIKLAIKYQREKERLITSYSENIISLGFGVKGAKGSKGVKG